MSIHHDTVTTVGDCYNKEALFSAEDDFGCNHNSYSGTFLGTEATQQVKIAIFLQCYSYRLL